MAFVPAHVPNDLYTIYIYDHSGNLYHILRKWDRLEFSQRINDPWNHSIQVRVSPNDPTGELLRSLLWDYFVIIERYDLVSLEKDEVYAGIHQTSSEQTQTDGNIIFTLYGAGFTKFLDRRIVLPPPGEEHNSKNGVAETVIKEYVYDCMISPTGLTNTSDLEVLHSTVFVDTDRIMTGLSISPDLGRGSYVYYNARFTNLDSVVKALAEDGGLDYGITRGYTLGTFVFDARPLWGLDRTVGNRHNPPAAFSLEYGNMLIPILSTNHRHEKNYVYVAGSGEGTNRLLLQYEDTDAIAISPWGRSELLVDARQEGDEDSLPVAGTKALKERGTKTEFTFDLRQTRDFRWIRNWGLGDLVTAYYRGRTFTKKISKIQVVVSLGGQQREVLTVELQDV